MEVHGSVTVSLLFRQVHGITLMNVYYLHGESMLGADKFMSLSVSMKYCMEGIIKFITKLAKFLMTDNKVEIFMLALSK